MAGTAPSIALIAETATGVDSTVKVPIDRDEAVSENVTPLTPGPRLPDIDRTSPGLAG
jgi:hypothetical protein